MPDVNNCRPVLTGTTIDQPNALELADKSADNDAITDFRRGPTVEMDQEELRQKIADLKLQHRDLDEEIDKLIGDGDADQLLVQRLKKQKLHLKDQIATLENQLLPDIIA